MASPTIFRPCRAKREPDAFPAIAAVGVDLVEDGHALAADLNEMIDQPAGFLVVGSPQVEHELAIGRLALGLGAGEREEEQHRLLAVPLQERQAARGRGGADVVEEQEHVVVIDQANRVVDRRDGIVAVVVRLDDDLAAVDAALAVDLCEIRHRPAIEFDAQRPARPREGGGHADHDFLGGLAPEGVAEANGEEFAGSIWGAP